MSDPNPSPHVCHDVQVGAAAVGFAGPTLIAQVLVNTPGAVSGQDRVVARYSITFSNPSGAIFQVSYWLLVDGVVAGSVFTANLPPELEAGAPSTSGFSFVQRVAGLAAGGPHTFSLVAQVNAESSPISATGALEVCGAASIGA